MERERIAWLSLALLSALLFVLVRPHRAAVVPADLTSGDRLALGLAIDVNDASTTELESIPGIGPTRAAAIVADRARLGPFANVDALERVKGIGPATVDAIRPYVTAVAPRPEGE
jgi:competence protein ComEA